MLNNLTKFFKIALGLNVIAVFIIIIDFGFNQSKTLQAVLNGFYLLVLFLGIATTIVRYYYRNKKIRLKVLLFDFCTVLFSVGIIFFYACSETVHLNSILITDLIKIAIFMSFFRELSEQDINYNRTYLNPAQLFIMSFLVVIFLGALLLMLPNATASGISFLDALFTATSAVCVTGLAVVDTGLDFTREGQLIIMLLIQIGGLGILTFASYFSYFFKGGTSYETQLSLNDITSSHTLGNVFSTLQYILLITFTVEGTAALLLYFSLDASLFDSFFDQAFFAVFHAVSAFCNAGFSTLSNGLFEEGFRYNYSFQLIIIGTFVFGGLGFPIVVNVLQFLKKKLLRILPLKSTPVPHSPWALNINSRINLITTFSILIVGTTIYFALEYHHSLVDHTGIGKFVTALFGATTPRTAGFNTVDMGSLAFPTVLLVIFLMWVGASPESTGGGIKTSTFALAVLNVLNLAKGKSRIEVLHRQIADISIKRAFAVMALSIMVIGIGTFLLVIFEEDTAFLSLLFECVSAYSTAGLSLGITSNLGPESKFIIIIVMFIGRVSMLTLMIAIFKKIREGNYKYPEEEIIIN